MTNLALEILVVILAAPVLYFVRKYYGYLKDYIEDPVGPKRYVVIKDETIGCGEKPDPNIGPTPPYLPFSPPSEIIENGKPSLSNALNWRYQLAPRLYGREDELKAILEWAKSGEMGAKVQIITGPGGSGKTRLAAEAALELNKEWWSAGFWGKTDKNFCRRVHKDKGVFLVLDYPEERPDLVNWLFEWCSEHHASRSDSSGFPMRLRLLLLTRQSPEHWARIAAGKSLPFDGQSLGSLEALDKEMAREMIQETAQRFADVMGKPTPCLESETLGTWLDCDGSNRLPLFCAAAAIEACQSDGGAFELSSSELLLSLAGREERRVREISERLKLGPHGLSRLLSMASLADGLAQQEVDGFTGSGIVTDGEGRLSERLMDTPWWRDGQLAALQPDRLAAAYIHQSLFPEESPKGDTELPKWLFLALKNRGDQDGFGDRLSRILYDLAPFEKERGLHPLSDALVKMITNEPARSISFREVAMTEVSSYLAPFAASVGRALLDQTQEPAERARHLTNLGNCLSLTGEHAEALKTAQESVEIHRKLAKQNPAAYTPGLAMSLTNLGNCLSLTGKPEEALKATQEAVRIRRELAKQNAAAYAPNLANSLNNLGIRLSKTGKPKEALEAAQEAVRIRRELAKQNPEAYTPDLAMSLNNLGIHLSEMGDHEAALKAAQEAVEIDRKLAKQNPAAYEPGLAESLTNLGNRLSDMGKPEEALEAAQESVQILAPHFLALPAAHERDMKMFAGNYLKACKKLHQKPDGDLLEPILAALEKTEDPSG